MQRLPFTQTHADLQRSFILAVVDIHQDRMSTEVLRLVCLRKRDERIELYPMFAVSITVLSVMSFAAKQLWLAVR
jgi:hypothetical protein